MPIIGSTTLTFSNKLCFDINCITECLGIAQRISNQLSMPYNVSRDVHRSEAHGHRPMCAQHTCKRHGPLHYITQKSLSRPHLDMPLRLETGNK